jgi:hypothetical protein
MQKKGGGGGGGGGGGAWTKKRRKKLWEGNWKISLKLFVSKFPEKLIIGSIETHRRRAEKRKLCYRQRRRHRAKEQEKKTCADDVLAKLPRRHGGDHTSQSMQKAYVCRRPFVVTTMAVGTSYHTPTAFLCWQLILRPALFKPCVELSMVSTISRRHIAWPSTPWQFPRCEFLNLTR